VSHGGGTFPWTHPRLRLVDRRDDALLDKLVARLWADTLVFDPLHMPLLVDRFGADHLVLGSDYPFIPAELHDPQTTVAAAVGTGLITSAEGTAMLGSNALSFLTR
jgi:aminocarboxymuconate-semialdehyde decarboxylase